MSPQDKEKVSDNGKIQAEPEIRPEVFAKAFAINPAAICVARYDDGRIMDVNASWQEMFGYSREEAIGQSALELNLWVVPQDRDAWVRQMQQHASVRNVELTVLRKTGEKFVALCSAEILAVGEKRFVLSTWLDISDHKRMEQELLQSQKMEAIGKLAGGVAHDFNNMLNVINGYCELMLDELGPNNPLREDLNQIRLAGKRAAALTTQLLAFSRKQILQPEILDLNALIEALNPMLRRLIREDIEVATIMDPRLGRISADPMKMQQVIMNLVVNAGDAMPEGGKLTIETANADLDREYARKNAAVIPGPYVMLAISDSGTGMDEETRAHLFEPFFTTKGKGKGTGMGLSTVYGIVKQSNGFIWVYSEQGKGTTFKIYLPRMEGQAKDLMADTEPVQDLPGTETVLVVEDEPAVRSLTCRILRERGYAVLEASNGAEALEIARKHKEDVDLLITDVIMPGMSGRDLSVQITASRPEIRTLFVSGYTDNAIVHHGILDADVAFLQKPFTVQSLCFKVREVLDSPWGK